MRLKRGILIASLAAGVAFPGDAPKTIPAPIAAQLKDGKKIDHLWVSPDFPRTEGLAFNGEIDYQAEELRTFAMKALQNGLATIHRPTSKSVLSIAVVDSKNIGVFTPGKLVVEGLVKRDGVIVAAFATTLRVVTVRQGTSIEMGVTEAVDRFIAALAIDLK